MWRSDWAYLMETPTIREVLKSLGMVAVLVVLAMLLGLVIQLVGNLLLYMALMTLCS